jgi:putative ABC transport system ATP-binding protein
MEPIVAVRDMCFAWPGQSPLIEIPSLDVRRNERIAIHGRSGCGKSTLLHLLAGVHTPQRGSLRITGQELRMLSEAKRDRLRGVHIGVVFQQLNLIPFLGALDNVLLPCRYAAERALRAEALAGTTRVAAMNLLDRLGIDEAFWCKPAATLSVGQQQRVAVARALIGSPALLLADEPTSALDPENRDRFMTLLLLEASRSGTAVVLVSHDPAVIARFPRQVAMADFLAPQATPCN